MHAYNVHAYSIPCSPNKFRGTYTAHNTYVSSLNSQVLYFIPSEPPVPTTSRHITVLVHQATVSGRYEERVSDYLTPMIATPSFLQ